MLLVDQSMSGKLASPPIQRAELEYLFLITSSWWQNLVRYNSLLDGGRYCITRIFGGHFNLAFW